MTDDIQRTIDELRGEIASLREQLADQSPIHTRRQLFRIGGAAALGAVAAAAGTTGVSEAAGNLVLDSTANTAISPTGLSVQGTFHQYGIGVTDNALSSAPLNATQAALLGHANGVAFTKAVSGFAAGERTIGVSGFATGLDSIAVRGFSAATGTVAVGAFASGEDSVAVRANSEVGVGLHVSGGAGAILIEPSSGSLRSRPSVVNTIDADDVGNLWHCVTSGDPGTWRLVSGPTAAGAFIAIDPTRVYDSRLPDPAQGALASGASRAVSVAFQRDAVSGKVVQMGERVPEGATAIAFNITITETAGAGFLAVAPGNAASSPSSSINWTAAGQTIANGLIVKIHSDRTVKVFAGGAGSAHFIIDVNGFWR